MPQKDSSPLGNGSGNAVTAVLVSFIFVKHVASMVISMSVADVSAPIADVVATGEIITDAVPFAVSLPETTKALFHYYY
jgi:hypothetical protein